ncbi:DUF2924 domain-containing protein [Shinella zoogloeoides]|uniref:DUF2924 domain-containing protein n=1 Tax=Shinella zoogloeoides TaxID=352475 RepID=UPI00273ED6FD|nr:DUF2924 domain-containing protein [Shinella zoogloeoides]WLR91686.1 DUF2924 domain-containing protein [Shinella zoogloeoides]
MAGNRETIEEKVAALGDLPREELIALWRRNFGTAPPKGVHRELLIRAASFHLQQKHSGGLSGEAKRLLKVAMREVGKAKTSREKSDETVRIDITAQGARQAAVKASPAERRPALPGARLIRDWNGSSHVVDVVNGGFIYAGSRYRSLSGIAREITGTNWSGPRFFGL